MTYISQRPARRIGGGNFWGFDCVSSITHNSHRAVMRTFVCIAALFASISVSAQEPQDTTKVFICQGSSAYAYHVFDDCEGLNKCNGKKSKVTVNEAKRRGYKKFCGFCRQRQTKQLQLRNDKVVTKSKDVL